MTKKQKQQKEPTIILGYLEEIKKKIDEMSNYSGIATKDVLTVNEAALFTGYSTAYIYQLSAKGILPTYKPNGQKIFFEKADLLCLIRGKKCKETI